MGSGFILLFLFSGMRPSLSVVKGRGMFQTFFASSEHSSTPNGMECVLHTSLLSEFYLGDGCHSFLYFYQRDISFLHQSSSGLFSVFSSFFQQVFPFLEFIGLLVFWQEDTTLMFPIVCPRLAEWTFRAFISRWPLRPVSWYPISYSSPSKFCAPCNLPFSRLITATPATQWPTVLNLPDSSAVAISSMFVLDDWL